MTVDCTRFVAHLQSHAVGRAQAWTAKQLSAALDVSDRALRELAHEATEAGILVCADNAGYFVPATSTEVEETVGRLRSQAHEMLTRATTLAKLADARFAPKAAGLFDAPQSAVTARRTSNSTPGRTSAAGFDPRGAFSTPQS